MVILNSYSRVRYLFGDFRKLIICEKRSENCQNQSYISCPMWLRVQFSDSVNNLL